MIEQHLEESKQQISDLADKILLNEEDLEILKNCISLADTIFGINFLRKNDFDTIGKNFMEVQKAKKITPHIVKLYRHAKIDLTKNETTTKELFFSWYSIQFVQIISAIDLCHIEEIFLDKLVTLFKSPEYDKFNSARHELLVYCKYKKSKFVISSLQEGKTKTPDFKITDPIPALIECKSILPEEKKDSSNITEIQEEIKRRLEKKKVSGFLQIEIKSTDLVSSKIVISNFIDVHVNENKTLSADGEHCRILYTPLPIIKTIKDFALDFQKKEQDIGLVEFQKSELGFRIIGINISPLRSNDYIVPLENQIKKAKKQFSDDSIGFLHVQFPEISSPILIDIIKTHSRLFYKHLLTNKVSALVVEFQFIKQTNNGRSKVYPNVSIPYLNPEFDCSLLLKANPYWINGLRIIDADEEAKSVFIEFDINVDSKTAVAFFSTKKYSIQSKIILINNNLLIETKEIKSLSLAEFKIDNGIVKNTNKLAYNFGAEKVVLNGNIIEGEITSHNTQ